MFQEFWRNQTFKENLKWFSTFLLVYFVQIFTSEIAKIGNAKPDFLLAFLFFYSVYNSQTKATFAGFLAGLSEDIFLTQFVGLMAFSKTIAGFLFYYFSGKKHNLLYFLGGFFVVAVIHFMIFDFVYLSNNFLGIGEILLKFVLPNSVYSLALSLLWILFRQTKR
ncbi:rod shape-determining protein MreD [bacterium]|nr:rod shape-determining protein MreD [bacterium]